MKFLNFIEALKNPDNESLIKCIFEGYEKIFEGRVPYLSAYQPEKAALPLQKFGFPERKKNRGHITVEKTINDEYRAVMYDEYGEVENKSRAYKNKEIADWEAKLWAEKIDMPVKI